MTRLQWKALTAAVILISGYLITVLPENPHDGLIGFVVGVLATLIVCFTFIYTILTEDK